MLARWKKPNYASYEAWIYDIDTALILEISTSGRVSGVYPSGEIEVGNLRYELYGVKFNRDPDICHTYRGFADREIGIMKKWQLAYEIDGKEAENRRREAENRGNRKDGFQLLTLVLVFLLIFTCERNGGAWSWSALWPFYGIYLIGGYLFLLTLGVYLYRTECSKWRYVQSYTWLIGPLAFIGGYVVY